MDIYSRSNVSDEALTISLARSAARDAAHTAIFLADIAEFDDRRLFAPAGYESMLDYCVHRLPLSEDAALKLIRAARAAREFPVIFPAVADGRLHLTGVVLLRPCLTPENVEELIAEASRKTTAEIRELIAQRFPRPKLADRVEIVASSSEQVVSTPSGDKPEV